eukprot:scaffold14139_cov74-Cyclotella_meneghiniana.AAC.5
MASAITALREASISKALSDASLSADGQTLTISSTDHDATAPITVPVGKDKSVTYSLASIYLMLMHPSVLQYRKACEGANVKDQVKILDKAGISAYFTGNDETQDMDVSDDEGAAAAKRKTQFAEEEASRAKHREDKRHSRSSEKKKKSRKGDDEDKKKHHVKPTPITNEQLVANLSTIVDKRDKPKDETQESRDKDDDGQEVTPSSTPLPPKASEEDKERELLLSWLSPAGFDVTSPTIAAAIEADREVTRQITDLEIPVGDSSSILRAGAGGEVVESGAVKKRDFSKVLEVYEEVMQAEERTKRTSFGDGKHRPAPPSSSKAARVTGSKNAASSAPKKIEGNPIIIVPNAMTSCITLVNAEFFLGKEATFIPRDVAAKRPDCGKRGVTVHITRKLASRLGGGEIIYDIIDNPTTRLKKEDWERVVAVIAQGASWQFKGWRYSDPVELFSRAFGFYVGYEGAVVPAELLKWNVKIGKLSRDRRGLDNICLAGFWNG